MDGLGDFNSNQLRFPIHHSESFGLVSKHSFMHVCAFKSGKLCSN